MKKFKCLFAFRQNGELITREILVTAENKRQAVNWSKGLARQENWRFMGINS